MKTHRSRKRIIFSATEQARIRARELRNAATITELALWGRLKKKQVCGVDFHRQKPITRFIVDFFAPDLLLAIEIDGPVHHNLKERDRERQELLEGMGIAFLRFSDREITDDLDGVVKRIEEWIAIHAM